MGFRWQGFKYLRCFCCIYPRLLSIMGRDASSISRRQSCSASRRKYRHVNHIQVITVKKAHIECERRCALFAWRLKTRRSHELVRRKRVVFVTPNNYQYQYAARPQRQFLNGNSLKTRLHQENQDIFLQIAKTHVGSMTIFVLRTNTYIQCTEYLGLRLAVHTVDAKVDANDFDVKTKSARLSVRSKHHRCRTFWYSLVEDSALRISRLCQSRRHQLVQLVWHMLPLLHS